MLRIEDEIFMEILEMATNGMTIQEEIDLYREIAEETDIEDLKFVVEELLREVCAENYYCPRCGIELTPVGHYEIHTELDSRSLEQVVDHFTCEWCGEDFE